MEVSEFFFKLLIILISAKFFAEVFAHLRLPSVLGEVIAGILAKLSTFSRTRGIYDGAKPVGCATILLATGYADALYSQKFSRL